MHQRQPVRALVSAWRYLTGQKQRYVLKKFLVLEHKEPNKNLSLAINSNLGVPDELIDKLIEKFDAVKLVKEAAEILDGKGGGGRRDFAQAGGISKDKIGKVFEELSKKIS